MHDIRVYLRFARRKPLVLIYTFALTTAVVLLNRYVSVMDYVAGLAQLAGTSLLDSVVSLAQFALSPGVRLIALAWTGVAAAAIALALALAFAGALGALARGAADAAGFPARPGMGAGAGYAQRFAPLAATLFVELVALALMVFFWLVAAIPLAVVNKAAEFGVIGRIVLWLIAALTLFVVYAGLLAWRALAIGLLPPLYADGGTPRKRRLSFCGARFFALARRFVASDILLVFFISLHEFFGKSAATLVALSACASLSMAFLALAAFAEYADFSAHSQGGAHPPGGALDWQPKQQGQHGAPD